MMKLLVLSLASASALKLSQAPAKPNLMKLRGGFDISSVSDLNLAALVCARRMRKQSNPCLCPLCPCTHLGHAAQTTAASASRCTPKPP